MNTINFFCSLMYLQKLLKKKKKKKKQPRAKFNHFWGNARTNLVMVKKPISSLLILCNNYGRSKQKCKHGFAWQKRKTMMVFWHIKGHYNLCFVLLNLLSYYKIGKLDYSGITTYQSVFNTTSCIWKKLVETKLQCSITSMKSLSFKGKRDNNASTHFYRYILFSCLAIGHFLVYFLV